MFYKAVVNFRLVEISQYLLQGTVGCYIYIGVNLEISAYFHDNQSNLSLQFSPHKQKTRMHSSRMRTVHCSSHVPGRGVSAQGVCLSRGVCVCLPRGDVCPGGVCPGGCLPGGCVCLGGCLPGGCTPPPLWTEFLTHACENITFPKLRLRAAIKNYS